MNKLARFSIYAALVLGIALPLLETVRRYHQMTDLHFFFSWFDDYMLGGFLLFAAYKAHQNFDSGQKILSAGWGAATAGLFLSFIGQMDHLNNPDPAPVSAAWVAAIKGTLLLLCILCLVGSLQTAGKEK
jgi:hypothetical protein